MDVHDAFSVATRLTMKLTLRRTLVRYFANCDLSKGTQAEYRTTLRKWDNWNAKARIDQVGRKEISDFLDYVFRNAPINCIRVFAFLGILGTLLQVSTLWSPIYFEHCLASPVRHTNGT